MSKISTIIMPIYNKFLPECEGRKIALNLDLPDPTIIVKDPKTCDKTLRFFVDAAVRRVGKNGAITIRVVKASAGVIKLIIKDTSDNLTREQQAALATENISVSSRMGYGTTVTVKI